MRSTAEIGVSKVGRHRWLQPFLVVSILATVHGCDTNGPSPAESDWFNPSNDIDFPLAIFGCRDGRVLVHDYPNTILSSDHGRSVSVKIEEAPDAFVREFAQTSDLVIFAMTEFLGLFRLDETGKKWIWMPQHVPSADDVNTIHASGSDLYVGLTSKSSQPGEPDTLTSPGLLVTRDQGLTYHTVAPDVIRARCHVRAIWKDTNDRLYVGSDSGLFVSDSLGDRWTKAREIEYAGRYAKQIYAIAGDGNGTIYAAGSKIFRSTDRGATWKVVKDNGVKEVRRIAASRFGYVIVAGDDYVHCSFDFAEHWSDLTQDLQGEPTAVAIDSAGYVYAGLFSRPMFRTKEPIRVK
jgi:hypothetical protein